LRRWLAKLPHPFTAKDREAGYRYDISILQAEFSLTQILDRPLSGRLLFEEIIRENLDTGLPTSASAPLCSLPGLMHVFTGPGLPKCCQTHPPGDSQLQRHLARIEDEIDRRLREARRINLTQRQ
jgi:hypothetical protein